ncbi:MAG: phosphoglycerate dehydrogenase [Myxococcota bacterium]
MARVLISDKLSEQGLRILEEAQGIDVDYRPGLEADELCAILPAYEGLIIRSGTKVTADVLLAAEKLRVIGRAGIGVDNVDLAAATARGILVMNTPEGNAITTAEHAISLMTALARKIPQATASMKAGRWEKSSFSGKELYGQVLGIVGLGNIGSIVADRARGLRMRVIAFDPLISEERAERIGAALVSLEELLERSDVISIHVPLTKDTRGLIDAHAFDRMKEGVLIVNAARGGIVVEQDLLAAIERGKVAGAALDVFEKEPPPTDHPLLVRPEVIATPHLGAATAQAQINVAIAVAEQVRDFLTGGAVRNAVNLPSVSADQLEKLRPFIVLGEKLGLFQGQLVGEGGILEIDVEFAGQVTEYDVQPVTLAVLKGVLEPWIGERINFVNAPYNAQQRGIRVIESKAAQPQDFVSLLTVRLRTRTGQHLVAGTLFGRTQPRIVRVDDFFLEAIPEGATLLIRNDDRPGVVGHVGTTLGAAQINISRMQLGLNLEGTQAVQLLNVDPAPDERVLDAVRGLPGIQSVHLLDLGPLVT